MDHFVVPALFVTCSIAYFAYRHRPYHLVIHMMAIAASFATNQANKYWGLPTPVQTLRSQLSACEQAWRSFEQGFAQLNESVAWLDQYCSALDFFNTSVLTGILDFAQQVTKHSARETTDPEVALSLVTATLDRMERHKQILQRVAGGGTTTVMPKHMRATDLTTLLGFIQYFELLFTQMEGAIYGTLRVGRD